MIVQLTLTPTSRPETSWSYGPSVDWAGVVVERLTQLTLQEYMRSNIWQPLGIRDMTFFLSTRPDMQARAAHMTRRVRSGGPAEKNGALVYAPAQPAPDPDAEDCLGGEGLFASPRELFKVVHAVLLACGPSSAPDTSTIPAAQLLLRRSTAESMFRPQLGRPGREALQRAAEIPRLNRLMGDMPVSAAKDWGLGGLLLMDDLPGWRGKGTMTWGGSPNLNWVSPKVPPRGRGLPQSSARRLLGVAAFRPIPLTNHVALVDRSRGRALRALRQPAYAVWGREVRAVGPAVREGDVRSAGCCGR